MGVGAAIAAAAVVGAVTTTVASSNSASAAKSAAATESAAELQAANLALTPYQTTEQQVQPYVAGGINAFNDLQLLTGTNAAQPAVPAANGQPGTPAVPAGNPLTAPLTAPFQPTQAQLAATPGYQFTLNQGLQATQNGFASQGLAGSGSAIKGAANYAEGLAGTTFQQQFNNYLAQNQQIYSMLGGQANLGESAATQTGAQGVNAAGTAAGQLAGAGASSAAGTIGAANALNAGVTGVGSAASNAALGLALNNAGLFGSSNSAPAQTGSGITSPALPIGDESEGGAFQ